MKFQLFQTADEVVLKVNSTKVAVADNRVTLGDENATELPIACLKDSKNPL